MTRGFHAVDTDAVTPAFQAPSSLGTAQSTTLIASHVHAARAAVADHARALLDAGRLLQLQECAGAVAFVPGGLPAIMQHALVAAAGW